MHCKLIEPQPFCTIFKINLPIKTGTASFKLAWVDRKK